MTVAEHLLHETERFSKFVAKLVAKEPELALSFDEAVSRFREYEVRMDRLREELRPAYEASLRGESALLDMQEILESVLIKLRAKGIR